MKISIITVAYQAQENLEETILSVLGQDYTDLEYWVIDGGSTDGTLEILQKYQDRIHYLSEPDNGIYDAINKGIDRCTGEVIAILGADDYYAHQGVISDAAKVFQDSDASAVYGDLAYIQGQDKNKIVRYWKAGKYRIGLWYWGWMPPHLTLFVRKSIIEKVGKYQTNLICAGDYEWMLRTFLKHQTPLAYLPKILVYMRTGGTSNAQLKNRIRANQEDRVAWKMNEIKPWFLTLWLKPLRKIPQLFLRP